MAAAILLTLLALTLAAVAIVAVANRLRIHVIIRKDPDMPSIKERLAALETGLAGLTHPTTGAASTATVKAVDDRVTDLGSTVDVRLAAIEDEIGTDAEPMPAVSDPAPVADVVDAPTEVTA